MFDNFCISDFSKEESIIYLKALITVAMADNLIHETEKEYITLQAKMLSLDINEFWDAPEKDLSFLKPSKMSNVHRMVLLRDCIILSSVDGEYSMVERASILEIASMLHLEESDVENIEDWRNEYLYGL